MHWFDAGEGGLALGIRQTAIPLGGVTTSLVLLTRGSARAFLFLAALAFAGALAGAPLSASACARVEAEDVEWTLKDMRLWRLSFGTGLYLVAQVAITGFVVLFLVDAREFLRG